MVQAMDQEVVERTCKLLIREQTNVQAIDQGAVEGDIWIRKLLKERWMVQAMEGAIDGTSDRSRSSLRRYG